MKAVKQGLTWICQEHASVKASNWTACVMFAAIDLLTINHSEVYKMFGWYSVLHFH